MTLRRSLAIVTIALLAVIAGVTARVWLRPRPVTFAVLPFRNNTGDVALDDLARQLTRGAEVVLPTGRRQAMSPDAARADYQVSGEIEAAAGGFVVQARLVRVRGGQRLWTQEFRGSPGGLRSLVPQTLADAVDAALPRRPR